jgi:hypothetical protein
MANNRYAIRLAARARQREMEARSTTGSNNGANLGTQNFPPQICTSQSILRIFLQSKQESPTPTTSTNDLSSRSTTSTSTTRPQHLGYKYITNNNLALFQTYSQTYQSFKFYLSAFICDHRGEQPSLVSATNSKVQMAYLAWINLTTSPISNQTYVRPGADGKGSDININISPQHLGPIPDTLTSQQIAQSSQALPKHGDVQHSNVELHKEHHQLPTCAKTKTTNTLKLLGTDPDTTHELTPP